ncbi:hypothetical protein [uncultured Microbulbifer sp.]|uniref:portal protein n=1 Tax=uncultured Microbulbifer sp. TaxID=348147 RepID=UPI0026331AAC|nr:hypothetical protein [uncultured Microbulbifer sp.]
MSFGIDYAEKHDGLALKQLERFLDDIRVQPEWRSEADRACAYYDSNQITPEMRRVLESRGQPILIHNLMAPAIDGVLGLEARTRADWVVRPDDDDSVEVAEGINEKLNEAARMTRSDKACADAFAGQVKCGLDWVEVSRSSDPFAYPYRCKRVHRNEIFWDWHAESDLSNARWLVRRRWVDRDQAELAFPGHKDLIRFACQGWDGFDTEYQLMQREDLLGAYSDYTATDMFLQDWWDSDRERALIYEVYYRHYVQRPVMFSGDGHVLEVDPQNRMHQAILASGKVQVRNMAFPKMRLAYFIGPHRLVDVPSPHPHSNFPYVPFWGFREDSTSVPYGLGRRMMPAQDEVNVRRQKLTFLLNKVMVIKDEDALAGNLSDEEMLDEFYRADGVVNLNPNRSNNDKNAFRIEQETHVAAQQFSIMQEAQQIIQETAGVYSAFLGQESGAKSGVAIDSLVEQGSTTLAELTDNYRFARQQVGEMLMAHVIHDLSQRQDYPVARNVGTPDKTKIIVLNGSEGTGQPRTNLVTKAKLQVVLGDITSTPSYRAQVSQRMMELASSLPPDMQMVMLDLIVESTDLPKRDEIVKRIREVTGRGLDPEEMTPEQREALEAQQQLQQLQQDLGMEEAKQKVNKLAGEARKLHAQASAEEGKLKLGPAELRQLDASTEKLIAEMKSVIADVALKRSQFKFQQLGDTQKTG